MLAFSHETTLEVYHSHTIKGEPFDEPALHPVAIIATNAAGSLAAKGKYRLQWVKDFWELPSFRPKTKWTSSSHRQRNGALCSGL